MTLDQALGETLLPALKPYGFTRTYDANEDGYRKIVVSNGSIMLCIVHTVDDLPWMTIVFADAPQMPHKPFEKFMEEWRHNSNDFLCYLRGKEEAAVRTPDFENAFRIISQTLPRMLRRRQIKMEVTRWSLLLGGATIGLGLAASYAFILHALGRLPNLDGDTFRKQLFFLELSLVFYIGLYHTGIIGYRLLKQPEESFNVKHHSNKHLSLLHAAAIVVFIFSVLLD